MVRIDRVVTRGGDAGETSLGDGARIRKDSPRIEAIGSVDEANAAIGVLRLFTRTSADADWRASKTTCSISAPTYASPGKAATACA
jgi:cob(I)alamin adenosyltransferase